MKKSTIKVIAKQPKQPPELREMPNTLKDFQAFIGGYIETVTFDFYVLIVDEEGRLKNLPENIKHPHLFAPIVGNLIICGHDGEEFSDIDEDISDLLMKKLNLWTL